MSHGGGASGLQHSVLDPAPAHLRSVVPRNHGRGQGLKLVSAPGL